jgi:sialate O-acetylesterase
VGERLALPAERLAYGDSSVISSGPVYSSAKVEGNKIRISFLSVGSGLMAKGDEGLGQFAIAGADKKYVWAHAAIEGEQVVVWSDELSQPLYVRYAWADNPDGANLYNKKGLPASPFTTDRK